MKKIFSFAIISTLLLGISGEASASKKTHHTVEKGDTLWGISQKEGISISKIKEMNNLTTNIIKMNQKLVIKPDEKKVYIVKKGDTLYKIAKEYRTSVNKLEKWNKLSSTKILINQKLIVKMEKETEITNKVIKKVKVKIEPVTKKIKNTTESSNVEMVVNSTAYTASCKGCSGITRTGIDLRKNPNLKVISVDPELIPLGSKVWVEGYGEAIAGDTGGSIKGKKIDVFIPNRAKALLWGNRQVRIKIIK